MKLETYILRSIYAWPSLYYKPTMQESRRAILNQLFLVLGSGVEYNAKTGTFDKDCKRNNIVSISKRTKDRILKGEKLCYVYTKIDGKFNGDVFPFVWPDRDSKETKRFLKDIVKTKKSYLECGVKLEMPIKPSDYELYVEIWPKDKNEYEWSPYPFCWKYLAFVDETTQKLINRNLIQDDWREGIVEIYTATLAWFEDDAKFFGDRYYNWSENIKAGDMFHKNWDKHPDCVGRCEDYAIPYKEYATPKDMARDCVKFNRAKYIAECKQIIDYYK